MDPGQDPSRKHQMGPTSLAKSMRRAVVGPVLVLIMAGLLSAPWPAALASPVALGAPLAPTATFPLKDPFDYSDVLLLGNNNSQTSRNLTAHFAAVHNVPSNQVLYADLPDAETISDVEWAAFASWF